jgi:hypothetical protein
VDPAGVEPALPARQAGVFPLDHRPNQVETMGIEPISGCLQGILAALVHASPFRALALLRSRATHSQLRERESNPRRRAYETLLAPLQSTPQ